MKRWFPPVLALACVAALVVVSLQDSGSPDAPLEPGEAGSGGRDVVPAEEVAPGQAAARGAAILGTVLRAGRRTEARVEVRLLPDGTPCPLRATGEPIADADAPEGGFQIPGLQPGLYELLAFAADGTLGRCLTRIRHAGSEVDATAYLPDGPHAWKGRLVHADGAPCAGWARLKPLGDTAAYAVPVAERTAADGSVRLVGLHAGEYVLVFRGDGADGVERASGSVIRIPADEAPDFVVDAGCADFTGTVVSEVDFSPIEGAVVEVRCVRDGGEVSARLTTDAGGRFFLRAWQKDWSLDVRAEGYAGCSLAGSEPWRDRRIRLAPVVAISGRVVRSGGGEPLAGVPVILDNLSRDRAPGGHSFETLTGADGGFLFESASPGPARVRVRGRGWRSGNLRFDTTVTTEVLLVAEPAGSIRGRAIDGSGAGVPGVPVEVLGLAAGNISVTDASGRFAFDGLEMGDVYQLRASPAGAGPTVTDWIPAKANPVDTDIPLAAARDVVVEVKSLADGLPLRGARLTLASKNRYRAPGRTWITGADGRAFLDRLPDARMGIEVRCAGYLPPDGPIFFRGVGESGVVRVYLEKALLISGRVIAPPEAIEKGERVTLRREKGGNPHSLWHFRRYTPVLPDGTFCFEAVPPGTYDLSVYMSTAEHNLHCSREVRAGMEGLVLEFERSLRPSGAEETERKEKLDFAAVTNLRVYVTGPDGRPVPRASVRVQSTEGWGYGDAEVIDGRADIEMHRVRGELRVQVRDARTTSGGPLPFGYRIVEEVPIDVGEVRITLPPGIRVSGRVVDMDGVGVPGVQVGANQAGSSETMRDPFSSRAGLRTAWSGEDGGFHIEGLPEGPIEFYVYSAERHTGVAGRVTVAGGTRNAVLRVRPVTQLQVTVADEAGLPLPACRVEVWSLKERVDRISRVGPKPRRSGLTDARGIARLDYLDPSGKFRLQVSPPASRHDLRPHSDYEWRPRDSEVRLGPGLLIRGRVRDGAGRPVPDALVGWSGRGGRTVDTFWDGTFEIGPMGPGALTLFAIPKGRKVRWWLGAGVKVDPGTEGVDLIYDPGRDLVVRIPNWPPPAEHEEHWRRDIWLLLEGDRSEVEPRELRVREDKTARFTDLGAEVTVTVVVRSVSRNRWGLRRGVSSAAGEIELVVTEGRRLFGSLDLPPGAESVRVYTRVAGREFQGEVEEDTTWEIPCLPEGEWEVEVRARVDGEQVTRKQQVRTGVKTALSLR